MNNFLEMSKKNRELIFSYVLINTIVLLGCFFMIILTDNSYEEDLTGKMYLYYSIFQLILNSILITLWEWEKKGFFHIAMFTLSSFPHTILLLSVNNMSGLYGLFPLIIQYIWAMVIISIKNMMMHKGKSDFHIQLILKIFICTVIIFSLIFFYYYYEYRNLVIVSIFDRRIPLIFFLNPVMTSAGTVASQLGQRNYLGYKPLGIFCVFWILISLGVNMVIKHGRPCYEKK